MEPVLLTISCNRLFYSVNVKHDNKKLLNMLTFYCALTRVKTLGLTHSRSTFKDNFDAVWMNVFIKGKIVQKV